jgi:hypothetical protein
MGPGVGRPAQHPGRLARFEVGSAHDFMDMCLHEKRKAKVVEKRRWKLFHQAGHVAWSVSHHLVSYRLSQVIGAPPQPYKYPCLVEIRTHTPLHGNSTWKALILSVVGMCSLIGRVVRL